MNKIIFVLPEYDDHTASHFRYTLELAESLSWHFEVFLFIEHCHGSVHLAHVQHYHVQRFHNFFFSFFERFFVFLYWRFLGSKLIYIHYSYFSALIGSFIMRFFGGKSFYWHCEQRAQFEIPFSFRFCVLKRKLFVDWPFRLILRMVHILITCTEKMATYYHEIFKIPEKKILVVHNWVDYKKIRKSCAQPDIELKKQLDIPNNYKVILFVHWLSPRKGSVYLMDIFEKIFEKRDDIVFLIIGDGPDKEKISRQIGEKKYHSFVRILGAIPNSEIFRYFSISDVFIVPSQNEEFGRVNIEAMACGIPIVATHTFATEAIFSPLQKRYCSDPGDIPQFVSHIQAILDEMGLKEKLRDDGFKQVEKYDKLSSVDKFILIFHE